MKQLNFTAKYKFFLFLIILLFLTLTGCNLFSESSLLEDDTDKAIKLVNDANTNLRSIRRLYVENNKKFTEFKQALQNKEVEKVKKLANDLQYAINDGYVLAENAKEKIAKAQELEINPEFREYLQLKESSLDLQIKAFEYRRQSAKLFRDEFGTENELELKTASEKFQQNEKEFAKYMKDAEEMGKQADKMAKESLKKKN